MHPFTASYRYERGNENCLHLVAARGSAAFVTCDRRLKGDDRIGVDVEYPA